MIVFLFSSENLGKFVYSWSCVAKRVILEYTLLPNNFRNIKWIADNEDEFSVICSVSPGSSHSKPLLYTCREYWWKGSREGEIPGKKWCLSIYLGTCSPVIRDWVQLCT